MAKPSISIIITSWKRKKYLIDCITSALNQSAPESAYEIIVVKNFKDRKIDEFIRKNKIIKIDSKEETSGGKIAEGVAIAAGDVIALLDDDDKFTKGKVKVLLEKFKDERLSFYHNMMIPIDDNDKRQVGYLNFPDYGSLRFNMGNVQRYKHILSNGGFFNNSSIALRKKLLAENIGVLKKIMLSIDSFCFATALTGGSDIVLDSRELTYYRIGSYLTNIEKEDPLENFIANNAKSMMKFCTDMETVIDMFKDKKQRRAFRRLIGGAEAYNRVWYQLYAPFYYADKRFAPSLENYITLISKLNKNDILLVIASMAPKEFKMKAIRRRYENVMKLQGRKKA